MNQKLSFNKRLKVFKNKKWSTESEVEVYWSETGIPYIYAKTDKDLFYITGVIQAFLRRSQLELFRYISQGRLSELVGKEALDIDVFLRTVDYGRAVSEIIKSFSDEELLIAKSFLRGINDYNKKSKKLPIDLRLMGIKKIKPWTLEDLVQVHRMTGSDVNWMVWPKLIKLLDEKDFPSFWQEWILPKSNVQESSEVSFLNETVLKFLSENGSNALVVGGEKTETKKPIVAGDPHLGLMIPNLWFFMGQSSPGYNSVGIFMPSFPIPVMGRTDHLSWTGTNMWGLSTYFYDLDEAEIENLKERNVTIKVRWQKDKIVRIRESEQGPIISDTKIFKSPKTIAMTWAGHKPSKEMRSFIKVNKAKSVDDFINSFTDYGQVALNFVVADKDNNIAKIHVINQPILQNPKRRVLQKSSNKIIRYRNAKEFPVKLNPDSQVIASSNEKIRNIESSPTWFNPPDYRFDRIHELLDSKDIISTDFIKEIQTDTFLKNSRTIVVFWRNEYQRLLPKLEKMSFLEKLEKWNFRYEKDLIEPYLFEELLSFFAKSVFKEHGLEKDFISLLFSHVSWKDKVILAYLKLSDGKKIKVLKSLEDIAPQIKLMKWGKSHTLKLSHPLSNVPVIGKYFVFYKGPYSGGNETVFKAAHSSGTGNYSTRFGANLRVIFDLSDKDKNYAVLLGGQDGYLWSEHTFDQFSKWQKGDYYNLYFSKSKVQETAKFKTTFNSL